MFLDIELHDGFSLKIPCKPSDSIKDIKTKIVSIARRLANEADLIINGSIPSDETKISDYGLQSGDKLLLYPRLRGGNSLGFNFVDMTQSTQRKGCSTGPEWREIKPGLCLEGKCKNEACIAYDKRVIISKEMGTYNLIEDDYTNKCPMCCISQNRN